MGNDGGSIPDRRDLVKSKAKVRSLPSYRVKKGSDPLEQAEQPDKANQTRAKWFFCALSKVRHTLHSATDADDVMLQRPLEEPVASCPLGKLYNKDAVLEYLLDRNKYGDGEEICGHLKSMKVRIKKHLLQSAG